MHELSLHDNAQACKQVHPGVEDAVAALARVGCCTVKWLCTAEKAMRLGSEYLEATSTCCSLEGVCNPSEQCDGEQGIVSVFCNHLGRPGNLQCVSKHLPKTAACLKPS